MLKFASALSDDYEYAIVIWGQSPSRPWGSYDEGIAAAPHLQLKWPGRDLTIVGSLDGKYEGATCVLQVDDTVKSMGYTTAGPTLTAGLFHGATVRLTDKSPILKDNVAKVGLGTVVAMAAQTTATKTTSTAPDPLEFDESTERITWVAHGLDTGDAFSFTLGPGAVQPTNLTAGTTYYVIKVDADKFQLALTHADALVPTEINFTTNGSGLITGTITKWARVMVNWTQNGDYTAKYGWILNDQFRFYDSVRMLTPWLPEEPGGYPAGPPDVPGYTFPDSITSYADTGLFLPFTFNEGIYGPGDTGTSATGTDATKLVTGNTWTANIWKGAYVRCGTSRAVVASNTTDTLTLDAAGWVGGTPADGTFFEVWIPYLIDNPHAYDPGYGFRQPSNDPMPAPASSLGQCLNKPRARTDACHSSRRFGYALELCYRLSAAIGKRINIIHLAINSASQVFATSSNFFGHPNIYGWWDPDLFLDWTPSNPNGSAARLERMIRTMAPAALLAEGNSKPLRILAIVGDQGQGDAFSPVGREMWQHTLQTYYTWLRSVITDAGLSPYASPAKIPICHAQMCHVPYELEGWYPGYGGALTYISGDADEVINAGVTEFCATDGFAVTFDTDDLTKVGDHSLENGVDVLHYDGYGEALYAARAVPVLLPIIDLALSLRPGARDVEICNLALAHLGDSATVASIDPPDTTTQARLCALFYPRSRDSLLEMHNWAFALRRDTLVELDNDNDQWAYAYALPAGCLKPIAVIADEATGDQALAQFVDAAGNTTSHVPAPQQFIIEIDAQGRRVLRTNLENARLRYVRRVADASEWPPLFVEAVAWHLASQLAGPLIKTDEGADEAKRCLQMMAAMLAQARQADAQGRRVTPIATPPWFR